MKWRLIISALTILLACNELIAQTNFAAATSEKIYRHRLGNDSIVLKITSYGNNRRNVLVNLHHNELTSLEAADKVLTEIGGMLINIENNNERLISFSYKGKYFKFDPNRIFTAKGINASLRRHSVEVTPAAIKIVQRFARFIREKIPVSKRIIAIHNNNEGELAIGSYMKGGDYARDVSAVNHNKTKDPDNFFLTTDPRLFKQLKTKGHNAILQNNTRAADDGSLSIYYGRRKMSYVNVEAEAGRVDEQEAMIRLVLPSVHKR